MVPLETPSLGLAPIPRDQAERVFAAAGVLDPEGLATPRSVAQAGQCFALSFPHGSAVLSVGNEGGVLWCYGLAGQGRDMTRAADAVLCRIARLSGFQRIGFQTARRGLVRRCRALGYTVAGQIGRGFKMEKDLSHG